MQSDFLSASSAFLKRLVEMLHTLGWIKKYLKFLNQAGSNFYKRHVKQGRRHYKLQKIHFMIVNNNVTV
jgi:hypothetical protein